ncbi:hypothetical protein LLH06_17020 [Mucilaginibacter daejeonensis]|uniref:hypothetical protein n=1 Tax=Mucilaginibacter daejeonensis TaxID=398049 RepID=UPI001D1769AF|nr:hypothetical protein [Mucilaginibacter daejeonensis]UEG52654.1 hypothetical protein LLH06_17020 [Mucilaginibacter daejeonensis]
MEQVNAKRLLYALVTVLIFEGLIRKLVPSSLGLSIFFLKDILCVIGLFFVLKNARFSKLLNRINDKVKNTFSLFIPIVLMTLINGGPILAIFGLKQYLLFCVIGFLTPIAYPPNKINDFKTFVFFLVLTLFPTVGVATLQNSLPSSHWLNLSVDGGSLEAFSAAGRLRVSSTFSFTGQFSWYLVLVCPCLALLLLLPKDKTAKSLNPITKIISIGAVICLFVGAFITGGRTAVLGCATTLILGFVLASFRSPGKLVKRGAIAVAVLIIGTGAIRIAKPEYFEAYDARSQGYGGRTQSEEIQSRVEDSFFSWTKWGMQQDMISILFGNGLGILSNGSEKLSNYAAAAKQSAFAESDVDVTFWEGGVYLMLIWYFFRVWLIIFCFNVWKGIKDEDWAVAASFLLSYIILNALMSAIGKQPPLNLWLWLMVGCIITVKNYTDYVESLKKDKKRVLSPVYNHMSKTLQNVR